MKDKNERQKDKASKIGYLLPVKQHLEQAKRAASTDRLTVLVPCHREFRNPQG
jgi:hypothetical protein